MSAILRASHLREVLREKRREQKRKKEEKAIEKVVFLPRDFVSSRSTSSLQVKDYMKRHHAHADRQRHTHRTHHVAHPGGSQYSWLLRPLPHAHHKKKGWFLTCIPRLSLPTCAHHHVCLCCREANIVGADPEQQNVLLHPAVSGTVHRFPYLCVLFCVDSVAYYVICFYCFLSIDPQMPSLSPSCPISVATRRPTVSSIPPIPPA